MKGRKTSRGRCLRKHCDIEPNYILNVQYGTSAAGGLSINTKHNRCQVLSPEGRLSGWLLSVEDGERVGVEPDLLEE